jgi:hypothetical protein
VSPVFIGAHVVLPGCMEAVAQRGPKSFGT